MRLRHLLTAALLSAAAPALAGAVNITPQAGQCSFVSGLNNGAAPSCVQYWTMAGNHLQINPPAMTGVDSPLQSGPIQVDVTYNGGGHTGLGYAFYSLLRCAGNVPNPGHCVASFFHTIASPALAEVIDLIEGGEGKIQNDGAGTINNSAGLLAVLTQNLGTMNTVGLVTSQVSANAGNIGNLVFYNIAFPSNAGNVTSSLIGYGFPNISGLSRLPLAYYSFKSFDPNAMVYIEAGQINGNNRTAIFNSGTTYTVTALSASPNQFVTGLGTNGALTTAQPTEANLSMSDITTNNASTGQHGLLKKLSGVATDFMNGAGAWVTSIHSLLSAAHSDTTASSVARGGIIVGQGSSTTWTQLPLGVKGSLLRSDGTDLNYSGLHVDCGAKTLSNTSNTLQTVLTIAAASNSAGALDANVTVTCNDGTNFDSISIRCISAWKNHAGTVTRDTPACTTTPGINDSGTCSIGAAIAGSGNNVIVTVQPVFTTIVPTTVTSYVTVTNHSAGAVTCG